MDKVLLGDCLSICQEIPDESVDLIYLDPPFNTGKDWGEFDDRWDSLEDYIAFLRARVVELYKLLKPTGSFYLHCDPTASHYIKVMLDEVFGRKQFKNEIVWLRLLGAAKGSQHLSRSFGNDTDSIFYYSVTGDYIHNAVYVNLPKEDLIKKFPNVDENGRRYNTSTPLFCSKNMGGRPNLCYEYKGVRNPHPSGWRVKRDVLIELDDRGDIIWGRNGKPLRKSYLCEYKGKKVGSFWGDVSIQNESTHTGYPTQKPIALLERIIKASSNPGDIVLDPFCGSGTTCVAAKRLGRRYIGSDINPKAIEITGERLSNEMERGLPLG